MSIPAYSYSSKISLVPPTPTSSKICLIPPTPTPSKICLAPPTLTSFKISLVPPTPTSSKICLDPPTPTPSKICLARPRGGMAAARTWYSQGEGHVCSELREGGPDCPVLWFVLWNWTEYTPDHGCPPARWYKTTYVVWPIVYYYCTTTYANLVQLLAAHSYIFCKHCLEKGIPRISHLSNRMGGGLIRELF